MPRILILHASVGTGHRSAALALADAFGRKHEIEARVEDTLDYGNELFRRAYANSYIELTKHVPLLWEMFYTNTNIGDPDLIKISNRMRAVAERLGVNRLERLIRLARPAAILCTHFLPAELLLRLKYKGRLPQPVYTVITDFAPHSFWITSGVDGYFVASDMTREMLLARDVPLELIHVSGIPIKLEVNAPKERAAMRVRHALPADVPLITLFGGGITTERVRAIVEGLLASDTPATLVVVAGRNEALVSALADLRAGPAMRLRVLGMIDYVDDLVVASDVVITKAGGLIVSEVLARGTPLVVIDPIPGQEEWNADYVVTTGAGIQLRNAESVPRAVHSLLHEPQRLAALRRHATQVGTPRAALTIADQVLDDLRSGHFM